MKTLIRWLMRHVPRPMLIRLSLLFGWVIRPFYRGNRVFCPVCRSSFRQFLPYGIQKRENVLCPSCLSLERHRLIWLYLEQKSDFFTAPGRVLHVAPEQCFYKRFKKLDHIDYVTADLESPMADLHFDLHHIPLDEKQFDWVICNHVLEHVADDRQVMKEILRVLKPGGRALLQVPLDYSYEITYEDPGITDPSEREIHFGQRDHLRVYGCDYPERLREAGFTVYEEYFLQELLPEQRERYRLPEKEDIYLCQRPK
ncbi:MAG: methyltransferase domain-containing protein [Bacteroidales bacterium]|nr:methyltransferase domain-containing protein [Bacteroidales bacterium]